MIGLRLQVCACAVAFFGSFAASAELSPERVVSMRAELVTPVEQVQFDRTAADAFVAKYSSDAVPVLIQMLSEDIKPELNKARIAFFLGRFRDSRATKPLISSFEGSIRAEISTDMRRVMGFTLDGLGFIGDAEALEFLNKIAGKAYWDALPVHPSVPEDNLTAERTEYRFRGWALRGLALSPNPKAHDNLVELRSGAASDIWKEGDHWLEVSERSVARAKTDSTVESQTGPKKDTPVAP